MDEDLKREGGGSGRRNGLKIRRRKACRFDAGPSHSNVMTNRLFNVAAIVLAVAALTGSVHVCMIAFAVMLLCLLVERR